MITSPNIKLPIRMSMVQLPLESAAKGKPQLNCRHHSETKTELQPVAPRFRKKTETF